MSGAENQDPWKLLLLQSTAATAVARDATPTPEGTPESDEGEASGTRNTIDPADLEYIQNAMAAVTAGQAQERFNLVDQLIAYKDKCVDETLSGDDMYAIETLADKIDEYLAAGNFSDQFLDANVVAALENLATKAEHPEIQLAYVQMISSLAQNRPEFQAVVYNTQLFENLIRMVTLGQPTAAHVMPATFTAISSIASSYLPGFERFIALNAVKTIRMRVNSNLDYGLSAKAARCVQRIFFSNFAQSDERSKYPNKANVDEMIKLMCTSLCELRRKYELMQADDNPDFRTIVLLRDVCCDLKRQISNLRPEEMPREAMESLENFYDKYHPVDKDQSTLAVFRQFQLDVPRSERKPTTAGK